MFDPAPDPLIVYSHFSIKKAADFSATLMIIQLHSAIDMDTISRAFVSSML